jgi:hypothetical protein
MPQPPTLLLAWRGEQRTVRAARPFARGDLLLLLRGWLVAEPTRHTIQVDDDLHLEGEPTALWRYLEHSCAPNARVRDRELLATMPIHVGDEITFDYDTTEWAMASPFACACGAPACRGFVRGFRHLGADTRAVLRPRLAPHLLRRLAFAPMDVDADVDADGERSARSG